jgi:hypothetical protein
VKLWWRNDVASVSEIAPNYHSNQKSVKIIQLSDANKYLVMLDKNWLNCNAYRNKN